MQISDDLTPHTAVSRLVSEYTALEIIGKQETRPGDELRLLQTIQCIAALTEQPWAQLLVAMSRVNINDYFPHDLDGFIRTQIDVVFDTAKVTA